MRLSPFRGLQPTRTLLGGTWLYLPRAGEWNLATTAAVLESDEIPEEEEDLPEAGVPEFAKANDLRQVLPITVVQDIVANLKLFHPSPTAAETLAAFTFYYDNDAFQFDRPPFRPCASGANCDSGYAASAIVWKSGRQFHGMSSSQREVGQSPAILAMTSEM